jgi:hypothetical protein
MIEQATAGPRSENAALARHASECEACANVLRADRLLQRGSTPALESVALPSLLASALRETKPTRTRPPRLQRLSLFGACAACLLLTLFLAPRPDLSLLLGVRLWLPLFALLATFSAGLALFRLRGPDGLGASPATRWLAVLAGLLLFHLFVVLETQVFPGGGYAGTPPRDCLLLGLLSGGVVLAVSLVLSRHTVLTGAAATGALAGASTGYMGLAVLHLHCPSESALHLHLAHGIPLQLLIVVGAWFGRRWLAV